MFTFFKNGKRLRTGLLPIPVKWEPQGKEPVFMFLMVPFLQTWFTARALGEDFLSLRWLRWLFGAKWSHTKSSLPEVVCNWSATTSRALQRLSQASFESEAEDIYPPTHAVKTSCQAFAPLQSLHTVPAPTTYTEEVPELLQLATQCMKATCTHPWFTWMNQAVNCGW